MTAVAFLANQVTDLVVKHFNNQPAIYSEMSMHESGTNNNTEWFQQHDVRTKEAAGEQLGSRKAAVSL